MLKFLVFLIVVLASGNVFAFHNTNHNNNIAGVGDSSNDLSISAVHEADEYPVNSAYAPIVVPTSDCLGSVSAGGQGAFWGGALGFTTQSKPCNIREFAKMVSYDKNLYIAMLCQDKMFKKAKASIGKPCPVIIPLWKPKPFTHKQTCVYPTARCKRLGR